MRHLHLCVRRRTPSVFQSQTKLFPSYNNSMCCDAKETKYLKAFRGLWHCASVLGKPPGFFLLLPPPLLIFKVCVAQSFSNVFQSAGLIGFYGSHPSDINSKAAPSLKWASRFRVSSIPHWVIPLRKSSELHSSRFVCYDLRFYDFHRRTKVVE